MKPNNEHFGVARAGIRSRLKKEPNVPDHDSVVSPTGVEDRPNTNMRESKVCLALRKAIKDGPPYPEVIPVNREYETRLYLHHGCDPYWPRVA
jgi:hypothetical protein